MQLRVLLFESAELQVGALQIVGVCVHPVFQHRLQNGRLRRSSCAQVFARLCPGKPRHRADHTRARLLQKAARAIVSQYGGELPADLQKLRALPGVGDYTSGAIASIAFGIPAAAVDGNVERVICRYFAISEEMGSPKSRRMIHELAQSLVPPDRPGAFANAMMEMGATMCTPKSPSCLLCPVRAGCKGYAQGMAERLPVKPKKKAQRVEKRCVMLVFCQNRVLTVLRRERLLGGLSVFPDAVGALSPAQMCAALEALGVPAVYDARLGCAKHVFTHLIWEMEIHAFVADAPTDVPDGRWVNAAELAALPMPTAVKAARKFAEEAPPVCGCL